MEANSIGAVISGGGVKNTYGKKSSQIGIKSENISIDKVSLTKSHDLLIVESLSYVNRKTFISLNDAGKSHISTDDLQKINNKFKDKLNSITNGDSIVSKDQSEYFNSENTANRIYQFATSFYETYLSASGLEDTQENRQAYRDIIGEAVDEGFQGALDVLGDLPDAVSKEVNKTQELVHARLDSFVTGEEKTYSESVDALVDDKVKELDKDQTGNLSLEESGLNEDFFKTIDVNGDNFIDAEEIKSEYYKLDQTYDLSKNTLDAIFEQTMSHDDLAEKANNIAQNPGLTISFLAKNPDVAQAVIGFSGGTGSDSFAEFLKDHPEAVQKIVENPETIKEVLRDFKLEAVTSKLKGDTPLSKDFLKDHIFELENLYRNDSLIGFFNNNKDAAKRLVDTLA